MPEHGKSCKLASRRMSIMRVMC